MANSLVHAAIGATVAVLPDIALFAFGWRKDILPESHKLVKVHRFIHSSKGLLFVVCLAWASHVVVDWLTPHNHYDK